MRSRTIALAVATAMSASCAAPAPQGHAHEEAQPPADTRVLVRFPEAMRLHTIGNMRDHLLALEEVSTALARGAYDEAAGVAESRLGMSSLEAHGASHVAPFMPRGMQEAGERMHREASRFALEAQNANATGDVRPALAALGGVMRQCVACHSAYRLQ